MTDNAVRIGNGTTSCFLMSPRLTEFTDHRVKRPRSLGPGDRNVLVAINAARGSNTPLRGRSIPAMAGNSRTGARCRRIRLGKRAGLAVGSARDGRLHLDGPGPMRKICACRILGSNVTNRACSLNLHDMRSMITDECSRGIVPRRTIGECRCVPMAARTGGYR